MSIKDLEAEFIEVVPDFNLRTRPRATSQEDVARLSGEDFGLAEIWRHVDVPMPSVSRVLTEVGA